MSWRSSFSSCRFSAASRRDPAVSISHSTSFSFLLFLVKASVEYLSVRQIMQTACNTGPHRWDPSYLRLVFVWKHVSFINICGFWKTNKKYSSSEWLRIVHFSSFICRFSTSTFCKTTIRYKTNLHFRFQHNHYPPSLRPAIFTSGG